MLVCALCAAAGLVYVCHASDHWRLYTYQDLATRAVGRAWVGVVAEVSCILFALVSLCSYGIVIGDSMGEIVESFGAKDVSRWLVVTPMITAMTALALLPSLDFLKYTSAGAIIGVVVVLVAVCYHLAIDNPADAAARGAVRAGPEHGVNILATLSLFGMAFTAHFAVLPIYKELNGHMSSEATDANLGETTLLTDELPDSIEDGEEDMEKVTADDTLAPISGHVDPNSRPRRFGAMVLAIVITCVGCSLLYTTIGVTGYSLLRDHTQSDLLLSFSRAGIDSWLTTAAEIAMAAVIACSYPVVCFAMRKGICALIFQGDATPYWIQALVTLGAGVLSLVLGGLGPDLGLVFQIAGTVLGSIVVYALPAAFHWKVGLEKLYAEDVSPEQRRWRYSVPAAASMGAGALVFVTGMVGIFVKTK